MTRGHRLLPGGIAEDTAEAGAEGTDQAGGGFRRPPGLPVLQAGSLYGQAPGVRVVPLFPGFPPLSAPVRLRPGAARCPQTPLAGA
ncbi:hypothetical protein chiPu_0025388 [Chiloscyllium punctatum]|uniref:Uncharacterized protein n=1 Tax=Chiloscyllium punctatum TaxID=137246 RepID=A0A401TEL1_CHIPU|nr:hypothetical protein [Chiloscyllium punctatum]